MSTSLTTVHAYDTITAEVKTNKSTPNRPHITIRLGDNDVIWISPEKAQELYTALGSALAELEAKRAQA